MQHKVNVILPMRAGSQRIINKNTKLLNDRPLYEYIIDTLIEAKNVNKIILNTDISQILNKYKTNEKFVVLERSDNLRDNCSMNLVIEKTLDRTEGEHFMQMHVTTPLITSETIDEAIKKYFEKLNDFDSLFSVTEKQVRFFDKNWKPINHKLEHTPLTEELEIWYEENSNFYLFSRSSFNKNKHRIGENPYLFKTRIIESIDLDTEEEFELAELLIKAKTLP